MEKPKKEYGNFTLWQFNQLISELPEIRSQIKEIPDLLNSAPEDKIKEILDQGLYWADGYELSFQELLALLICALGCHQKMQKAAQSADPTSLFIDFVSSVDMESWDRNARVTRASAINTYSIERDFSGRVIGSGGGGAIQGKCASFHY
jgi:hypothetical protein